MTLQEYEDNGVTGIATGVNEMIDAGNATGAVEYVMKILHVVEPVARTLVKRQIGERKMRVEAHQEAERNDPRRAVVALRDALRSALVERDAEIDALLCALLCREHVLLLGPPGTAKSLLARAFAVALSGTYFEWLMTKFSVPEELFGPVSVNALKADRFERMTTGKLPTAEFAFLDEVFKANAAIQNNLLSILNERIYHDGTRGPVDCPLELAVLASNELPQDDGLEAMFDRILVRMVVDAIEDDAAFERLISTGPPRALKVGLSREALSGARAQVDAMPLHLDVVGTISALRRRLRADGRYVSDRRWLKAMEYLRARAWLDGQAEVNDDTLTALVDLLWDDPSQRGDVERMILEIANPIGLRARSLIDAARAEWVDVDPADEEAVTTAGVSIRAMWDRARKMLDEHPDHPALTAAVDEIQGLRNQVAAAFAKLV